MTGQQLQAALHAGAEGLYALESGTGLLLAHGTWPAREDFRCFIHIADSNTSAGSELASTDWEAVIAALDAGECPSSGETRMLRLAASLAADVPVQLGSAVTGIDDRNVGLLVKAILHASGQRQFSR